MSRKKKQQSARYAPRQPRSRRFSPVWIVVSGLGLGLVALVIVLSGALEPPTAIEVRGRPSLKVDQEQVDLGEKRLGQTASVSFLLTNVGDQPLRVTRSPYVEVVEGC